MDRKYNQVKMRLDIFHAIKRAFMRRGILPSVDSPRPKTAGAKRSVPPRDSTASAESPVSSEQLPSEAPAEAEETSSSADKAEKEAEEGPEKLIELTERTHDILFEANTVFPFTLFPDTVTLDREKLTIAERFFWRVAKITSVPVSEILSCQANVGPFFGSINLVFSFFADNQRTIHYLWRDDTSQLQCMLHGYIIAHKRKINTVNVPVDELRAMLKELGQGASD